MEVLGPTLGVCGLNLGIPKGAGPGPLGSQNVIGNVIGGLGPAPGSQNVIGNVIGVLCDWECDWGSLIGIFFPAAMSRCFRGASPGRFPNFRGPGRPSARPSARPPVRRIQCIHGFHCLSHDTSM